jgi:hypothetical protein
MSQIVDDLRQVAIEIKTETQVGGNTAARVGGAFERVADALEGTQQIEDMDAAVAAVQQAAAENEQTIQDIVNNLAVVQTTGQSASNVMSQKAVSDLPFVINGYNINEDGFNIADGDRNVGLRYDNDGLNAGKLNPHFVELLKSEGVAVDCIASVEEDGLYVVDGTLNVGVKVDNDGIHSENVLEFLTINY